MLSALDAGVLQMAECERDAKARYHASDAYAGQLASHYQVMHHYFAPPVIGWGSGDQWPGDRNERPGKIHVSLNIIRPFLTSSAKLEAMLPRITIPTSTLPEGERKRAEAAEQLMMLWLDMSGWDVWMFDLCLSKGLYGKGVIKTFWNKAEKRGDAIVVERPENLRVGWGSNDYSVKDWAIYEYKLSPSEVKRRWPNLELHETGNREHPIDVVRRYADHDDPLGQKNMPSSGTAERRVSYRTESEYERLQIPVWDYWYRDGDDILNVILVGGCCVEPPKKHPELLDIPYIVIEHDHEPGSPEGVSGALDLIDLQVELNRLLSHGYQYVADNVDPAWQITGEDAAGMPENIVPKAGEAVNMGNSRIDLVPIGGANTFPVTEMMKETWSAAHRISGLPEIALGGMASSDISGRAVAVQIQSHANRMDPRRNRLYRAIKDLLRSWVHMATVVNPKVPVGQDEEGNAQTLGVADMLRGFMVWKIIAPEITPRDQLESAQVEIDKMNAKVQSLRTTMDRTGVENPEAEIEVITQERSNAQLFPGDVQAYVAIFPMLQQIQQQQAAMQQQIDAMGQQAGGMSPTAQAQAAMNTQQQGQFEAQPSARFEDQNQPRTQEGMPPPAEGQAPGQTTTLIRGGKALNQIAFGGG